MQKIIKDLLRQAGINLEIFLIARNPGRVVCLSRQVDNRIDRGNPVKRVP